MARLTALLAFGLLLANAAEGNFIDTVKNDFEAVSREIVARMVLGSNELRAIIDQASTEETKRNLNDLDGCTKLFNDLDHGEKLIKQSVDFGIDTAKAYVTGINQMLACGSLDFVKMGKCITASISKLKRMTAITKAGAADMEKDFKKCGQDIKMDWLVCIGKAPTTTTAAPTAAPTTAPTAAPTTALPKVK